VPRGTKIPSSLQNVFKELNSDIGLARPSHGDLERWAAQGVLLLNAVLSVRAHQANSHAKQGWETFTDGVIRALVNSHPASGPPLVWLLWGKSAQDKARLVQGRKNHVLLQSPHPSGLSAHRGFFGNRFASATNKALMAGGGEPIQWGLDG
jgi:uracil-DNA glycosylase